jgi:hypothetical protein
MIKIKVSKTIWLFMIVLSIVHAELLSAQVVQQWLNFYNGPESGGDTGSCIKNMPDFGIATAGYIFGPQGYNYGIRRLNAEGLQLWVINDTLPGNGYIEAMDLDSANNIYVTGHAYSPVNADARTQKYDCNGNLIWSANYNSAALHEYGVDCVLDSYGNLYVVGNVGSNFTHDALVLKYDAQTGEQLWVRTFSGNAGGSDRFYSATVDQDGNVYTLGRTDVDHGTNINSDLLVIKWSSNGDSLWSFTYNGTANDDDEGIKMEVNADGDLVVIGNIHSSTSLSDILILKLDFDGYLIWASVYDGRIHLNDEASSLTINHQDNSISISGRSQPHSFTKDATVLKYSSEGELIWAQKLGNPVGVNSFNNITSDSEGNLYLTGVWDRPGTGGIF